MGRDEAENQAEAKAQELYEKIWGWCEGLPKEQQADKDVIKSHTRVEVIKRSTGALDITVVAPDQFSVRAPRHDPKNMNENELLEAVKRWWGLPS
jgi:hypothetical protein